MQNAKSRANKAFRCGESQLHGNIVVYRYQKAPVPSKEMMQLRVAPFPVP
jgi:hypothetical protein